MVRKIVRTAPHFSEEDIQSILKLMESSLRQGSLTMGPILKEFETKFAKTAGVKHAIAVNSGTSALEIALRSVDISGREVILPTETFVASANAIILAGGKPVFAEINPQTLCLDLEDVARRINPKTAAVMLIHMAGLIPPNVNEFVKLCDNHGLHLIEDAAHAHGASVNGQSAGSFGRAGCFSFYATKVMTTAEGGMITTNDDGLAEMALSLRNHGANLKGSDYLHVSTNWRLSEPQAAIGLIQLRRLESFLERRNQIAQLYNSHLDSLPGIQLLSTYAGSRHSYWNYLALLEEGLDRVRLAALLRERFGVPIAWPYDPPCHLQPVFRRVLGCGPGDLPVSEKILRRHIALPMHVGLSDDDAGYVIESLKSALKLIRL